MGLFDFALHTGNKWNDSEIRALDKNFNSISNYTSFKYDFGTEYKKGFYMTLGPRFSFLIKTESDENSEDTFENLNIGLQLGLATEENNN